MTDIKKLTTIFEGLIITIVFIFILQIGKSIFLPLVIALFLSFILDPVVQFMTAKKIPRTLAVLSTILFTFFLFYLVGLMMYASITSFSDQFPIYEEKLKSMFGSFSTAFEKFVGKPFDDQLLSNVNWFDTIKEFSITQRVLSSVGTFFTFLGNVFLVIIFVVYFLQGKVNLFSKVQRAFEKQRSSKIIKVIDQINSQVQVYLGTKTLISLITALLSLVIFWLFGLDFAIIWAFIIFMFNFIPNFGSILASILPLIIASIQFDSFLSVIWLAVALILIQFLMGNVLEPRIMGHSLNLSPLMVILSLIFWGWLWGVPGMLLAVPILAMVTIIFENIESLKFISVFLRGEQKIKYY